MESQVINTITKLCELILQCRLDVKKQQFKRLDLILKLIHSQGVQAYNGSVQIFLSNVLDKEIYHMRKAITNCKANILNEFYINISFSLTSKKTGNKIIAESWEIETQSFKQKSVKYYGMILNFFEEIIVLLNKKPLFSVFQKNNDIKVRYILDYQVSFQRKKQPPLQTIFNACFIVRHSEAVTLRVKCLYLPKLTDLQGTNKKIESAIEEEGQRKRSFYSFYDQELDFIFISSDDQSFRKTQDVEEVELEAEGAQNSEEFEILFLTEEERFLENNEQLFNGLVALEPNYFQS